MMLDYLEFDAAATRLRGAVSAVYREGRAITPDQGGTGTTTEFCAAVQAQLGT